MLKRSLLTAFIAISAVKLCVAHWDGAYMRNPDDGFTLKRSWMSEIKDNVKLLELALPGTEKSGAFDPSQRSALNSDSNSILEEIIKYLMELGIGALTRDILCTQALNFKDQLNYGIRVFDIQVLHVMDNLMLTVAYSHLGMTFDTVLDAVQSFLLNHPTETVLINLYASKRISPSRNKMSVEQVIDWYLNQGKLREFYLPTNDVNITLGQARGKFILTTRETPFSSRALTLNAKNSRIMDTTYLHTNWDLYWGKWIPVKNFLKETSVSRENKIFINFISGWGGSFPYFVASGHSSPGTGAPRLATGLTTPGWDYAYPDFPRVGCFIGICTIAFEGTNILSRDLVRKFNIDGNYQRTVGIILIDFPGEDLIKTIIENNHKLKNNVLSYDYEYSLQILRND